MTFNATQNFVVCDWVELPRSEYLEIERQVPAKDASTEEKRKAQKERARKSGIEALENKGENLSFPKGDPTVLRLYGDSCLPAGTIVYTTRGAVPIETVEAGDKIFGLVWGSVAFPAKIRRSKNVQRIKAEVVIDEVVAQQKIGAKEVYEIQTNEGRIRATANHKFLAVQIPAGAGTTRPRELVWLRVDELNEGDRIILANPLPGPEAMSANWMRFLGYYLGDGWFKRNAWVRVSGERMESICGIQLACSDKDEAGDYAEIIADIFDGDSSRIAVKPHHQEGNQCWVVTLSSSEFARKIASMLGDGTAHTKSVPDWVFACDEKSAKAFLQGYIDADGSRGILNSGSRFLSCVSVSHDLIRGMRDLARYVGWGVTNIHFRKPGYSASIDAWCSESYSTVFYPDRVAKNTIGRSSLFTDDTTRVRFRSVQSIVLAGVEDVYDIQTKTTQNFIAEGFVVHNCNLKFPLGRSNNKLNLARANNARTRFKQFADTYTKTKSKKVVHNRIVKAQLAAGASPGFDENDPLDKLLDKSVKDKLKRSGAVRIGFEIIERQEDKQLVTGIVMDPVNVDAFGNRISDEELIERIAFGFMAKFQDIGTDHASKRGDPKLVVVESFIARTEQKIGNAIVPKGAWVLTVRVMDVKVWERVKRGDLNGFSLEGVFVRIPIKKKAEAQQKKAA